MTAPQRSRPVAQPVHIDLTGATISYTAASNGSNVAVARLPGRPTVMGFGAIADSIVQSDVIRGVAVVSRGTIKIVGREVGRRSTGDAQLVDENGERMPVPSCDDMNVVFHRPIPVVLVDEDGHPEEHVFDSMGAMAESFGLDTVGGIAREITSLHGCGDVFVCLDPYAEDVRGIRALLVAGSIEALLADREEARRSI